MVDYYTDFAVSYMTTYLRSKYSATTIFNETGANRNILLMTYCKDIAIYHLYAQSNIFRKIPSIRLQKFAEAIGWLEAVQSEKINPLLYGSGATGYTIMVKAGSNDKRENYMA